MNNYSKGNLITYHAFKWDIALQLQDDCPINEMQIGWKYIRQIESRGIHICLTFYINTKNGITYILYNLDIGTFTASVESCYPPT